jgi:predicted MFS family arabinose efflux permease
MALATLTAPTRGPFSHLEFSVIWAATLLSLTGIAISDAASSWLMTTIDADPRAVSMVQVASNLPMFLFTLPAGALADLVKPRTFLIGLESLIVVMMAAFGAAIYFHWVNGPILLCVVFVLGASWSIGAPAWMAVTPMLVPSCHLEKANAANGVGYNVSRAVGPAIAGVAIARFGPEAPYWLFAAADLCSVFALIWWRPLGGDAPRSGETLHAAVAGGISLAFRNPVFRRTLARTVSVYPFAAAYVALLPLVAARLGGNGSEYYGDLLGLVSVGAIVGAFVLRWLRARFNHDETVALGTLGLAAGLVLFGLAQSFWFAALAAVICGASWTVVLAVLYCAAQLSLADGARGRGLGVFLTAIFGCVTAGAACWGQIAAYWGLSAAFFVAAAAAITMIPVGRRWKLEHA